MNMPHARRMGSKRRKNQRIKKRKRPDSIRVPGRSFEQPSPEVCSPTTLRCDHRQGNGTNG